MVDEPLAIFVHLSFSNRIRMQEQKKGYFDEYENLNFHPYNILLFLMLFGVVVLFLSLSVSFMYTRVQANLPPVQLPFIFILNTLILVGSSWTLWRANKAYKEDDTEVYKSMILYTVLLSFLFLVAQIVGWYQLFASDYFLGKDNSTSYLYVISAVHFAHVIFGLPFLIYFLYAARKKMIDPVTVLVYFSDPSKRLNLRLLTIYWHFLDLLWVYLVFFFWVNWLIR